MKFRGTFVLSLDEYNSVLLPNRFLEEALSDDSGDNRFFLTLINDISVWLGSGCPDSDKEEKYFFIAAYQPRPWVILTEEIEYNFNPEWCGHLNWDDSIRNNYLYFSTMKQEVEIVKLDMRGGLHIPLKLRELAGIERKICLVGDLSHISIWNRETLYRYIANVRHEALDIFDTKGFTLKTEKRNIFHRHFCWM